MKLKEKNNNFINSIPNLCRKMSYHLAAKDNSDEDTREMIQYALEGIVCTFWTFISGLAFAILFKVWIQYLVCMIPVLLLRQYAGGAHFNDTPYSYCWTFSVSTLLLCAFFAQFMTTKGYPITLYIITTIWGIATCFGVPRASCSDRERGTKKRKEFKIKFIIGFLLIQISSAILLYFKYSLYSICLSVGLLWVYFLTTDIAYILIHGIENLYNKYIE